MSDEPRATGKVLRTRRLELGLSHREVADLAGVTRTAIDQVEHGADLDAWPHGSVRALLNVLRLSWDDLDPPTQVTEPSRVAQLGAELARSGRVTRTQMAHGDHRGVDQLRSALENVGMTAVETHEGLQLAPDAAHAPLPRVVREEDERMVIDGPNAVETEVLQAVIAGQLDMQRLNRSKRRALATLIRAGLVDKDEKAVTPSVATRRTLLLD